MRRGSWQEKRIVLDLASASWVGIVEYSGDLDLHSMFGGFCVLFFFHLVSFSGLKNSTDLSVE